MAGSPIATAHPSATIVLIRDSRNGLEVLLVRRSKKLVFHGGAWVFPGGRIDPEDYPSGDTSQLSAAARCAAVRELREEAGLEIGIEAMHPVSRWITPDFMPKRFDTWFFVAPADSHDVVVDGGEIREFRWAAPAAALAEHNSGDIELPPPTFVTLSVLGECDDVTTALGTLPVAEPIRFTPRICNIEGGACSLYEGDAGWEAADPNVEGPRHRLWLLESGWQYERRAHGKG